MTEPPRWPAFLRGGLLWPKAKTCGRILGREMDPRDIALLTLFLHDLDLGLCQRLAQEADSAGHTNQAQRIDQPKGEPIGAP
mgnify:CR=1 FL=1